MIISLPERSVEAGGDDSEYSTGGTSTGWGGSSSRPILAIATESTETTNPHGAATQYSGA